MRDKTGRLTIGECVFLILLPILTMLVCLSIGRVPLKLSEILDALISLIDKGRNVSDRTLVTVFSIRLPRLILALLVGAGLSTAGCAFQSLFSNPLATPDTIGVASGASFGAGLGIVLGGGYLMTQGMSFLFGLAAVLLTFFLGHGKRSGMNAVVLSGIMVGSLFSALVSLVKFLADSETELPAITYFLMGSLEKASYQSLAYGAVPIVIGIAVLFALRWRLNLLPYSEDEIRTFGVNVKALRGFVALSATIITASCVSMAGQVGWIGLIVPHMCRMKFKNNHLSLLPASVSIGASFMMIVDTLARSLSASEIPVSVLTAILGAPFFIFLMRKKGGWKL